MTKSRQIRIYPSATQKTIFRSWFGASRYVYNKTIEYLKTLDGARPSWMDVAKIILAEQPEWLKAQPYQLKRIAIKDACEAFTAAKVRCKQMGQAFEMHFRSRKNPQQSCYIPKSAVSEAGIYHTLSGSGLHYSEPLPDDFGDCRLVFRQGRWFLCVPFKTTVHSSENQVERAVAIDPGVRNFLAFYEPQSAGFIGQYDFGRIHRLCKHLDDLIGRITQATGKRRQRLRKAADRLRWKIRDLVDELHWKAARFLVDNFDVIFLPTFETSEMVKKDARKLRAKSVRAMLGWKHFQFAQRLEHLAKQTGKIVLRVTEEYTSKTASWSGEMVNVGGSEVIRGSDGIVMNRDLNGARGIFIKSLMEIRRALGDDPSTSAMA